MQIRTIQKWFKQFGMQIRSIWTGFEAFECKLKLIEKVLKRSNANSNHSKGNRSVQMQIQSIQNGFEAFECKF